MNRRHPKGAGLGFRRALVGPLDAWLETHAGLPVDFFEIAPENWIGLGGRFARDLRRYTERFPFVAHGLSLSLGGYQPLDEAFLHRLRRFLDEHGIAVYSEHLSYCSDDGHLYDLMPIPFTREAVTHVAERILRVQDIVGRPLAIENVSFYAMPEGEMSELDFLLEVLQQADCQLLLDVNNIHVNAVNHGYDAESFLQAIPAERICYGHIAGHYRQDEDLIIDTHGAAVIDPVWRLQEQAFAHHGVYPVLLERDFNFPPLPQLLEEVDHIASLQAAALEQTRARVHS